MITLTRLRETDLFGRFFLKASDRDRFDGYYSSLDAIRPLLTSEEWINSVTGYYINVAGNYNAVRLSYFTTLPHQVSELVNSFQTTHALQQIREPENPYTKRVSDKYGGEESRFRKFLSTYTMIGLDIMAEDLFSARCLLATFRLRVMRNRQLYKPHFLRTFESQSAFYNSLTQTDQNQFWLDLAHWPNPPQVDWAHMFVNMVLGCDWSIQAFLEPQPPLTISEINEVVREQGFQIPEDWRPI